MSSPADEAAATLLAYLRETGIAHERMPGGFALTLHGERKHSLPVTVEFRERSVAFSAFFMRRPMDNAGETYRMLLARNLRGGPVRFAADSAGDVYLVGEARLKDFSGDVADEMLGGLLSLADELFMRAVETGFASYLERERSWRAAVEAAQVREDRDGNSSAG